MKNEIKNLLPEELIRLARFCQAALLLLNARMFTLLGMLLSACLFGWVLWQPDWIRFAGAVAFAILVFMPLQRMENQRVVKQQEVANE